MSRDLPKTIVDSCHEQYRKIIKKTKEEWTVLAGIVAVWDKGLAP